MPRNNNSDRFDRHLSIILKKMCELAGVDFNVVDFDEEGWYAKHEWGDEKQVEFKKWLSQYVKSRADVRQELLKFPRLGKSSKQADKFADEFILTYGWKVKQVKQDKQQEIVGLESVVEEEILDAPDNKQGSYKG